jgi:hypothetical protein
MSYTKREGDQVIDGKSGEKVTGVSHGSAPHAASVRRASSESDVCGRFRGEDTVAYSLSQDTPADHAETRGRDTANQSKQHVTLNNPAQQQPLNKRYE